MTDRFDVYMYSALAIVSINCIFPFFLLYTFQIYCVHIAIESIMHTYSKIFVYHVIIVDLQQNQKKYDLVILVHIENSVALKF